MEHALEVASPRRSAPPPSRGRPDSAHGLLRLQQLGGNRAVAGLIQRAEAERIQRQDPQGGQSASGGSGGPRQTQVVVPLALPGQFPLTPGVLTDAGATAGGGGPGTGAPPQTAPTAPQPAQQTGGTAPQTGTQQPAQTPAGGGQQPAAAEGDHPRLGIDVGVGGTAGLGAFDTFDPANPSTPRSLQLRAPNSAAGDFAVNGALSFVWRDKNFRDLGGGWHLGHEPTLSFGAGLAPNAAGGSVSPGVSLGMDIFHRQVGSAIGQVDFHALQAQVYGNLGVPLSAMSGGMPNPTTAAYGLGVGGGVELHPGHQNRVSIAAYVSVTGGGTTDLSTGATQFNMGASANLVITGNLLNP